MDRRRISHQGHVKMIQRAIRITAMVVFLGYMTIWIMKPTNTFWLHWLPTIYAKTDSTYFGQQGGDILIHLVPVLFTSTLACLYLHLEGKYIDHHEDISISNKSPIASWRVPALVVGPLGIVSWAELSFLFMFATLILWSLSAYLHSMLPNITRQSAFNMGETEWEMKLGSVGITLGLVGNISLLFLFFPVTRGSSVLRLVGLTSESSIKYHIWLGHTAMSFFTAHGLCYLILWATTNQSSMMLKWGKVGISIVAGEVTLVTGLIMWATSFRFIRRKVFELFYYTHHLYIIFVAFFVLHVGFSYCWITLPGFYLFLIDRFLRFLQSQQKVSLVSARILPCQAIELNFAKSPSLHYNPMSIVFVNVPAISSLQWHPFTVTSSSYLDPEKLSVVIKREGSWSSKLYESLSVTSPTNHLEVSLEGPYGTASTHLLRHDMLVMFSGGSGITPYISIIREMLHVSSTTKTKIPRILLIPAFKNSADLMMLDLLLPAAGTTHDESQLQLQIQAYVTRERALTTEEPKHYHTILFKPNARDLPVSAILGKNSWLWLAAIILSSCVIFLVLIGVITQLYIYPIDHNTNKIYSYSTRTALNMLFISTSIGITATIAFLWNKKQNTSKLKKIQMTDVQTPMTSPGLSSWSYNEDKEMGILQRQSFAQSTKVYYGERPDFKNIILESTGSSIGVLVSGPKKMRQDVAAICSSGMSKNIQFESISFSW